MKSLITNISDVLTGKAPLGAARSNKWATVRKHFLEEHSQCAVCGSTTSLEVHHILPFHLDPEKELDPTNLIVLCESRKFVNCHLLFGHLGNYKNSNPDVREDAKIWNHKLNK